MKCFSRSSTSKATSTEVPKPDAIESPNQVWCADIERHEAPLNLAVVGGHRHRLVAVGRLKLRAA